jgi:LPXTG-motif cell wall-anchored protein
VSTRRLLAIFAIAAFGALAWGGATAGAQTTTTTAAPVFTCSYDLSSTALAAGGGPVTVSGIAPADTDVHVLVNGVDQLPPAHSDPTTGAFSKVVTITTTSTIQVTLGANYLTTVCVGPASVSVESAAAAAALPRTGSNDTKPFVLIGVALLVVGTVLVIATRRRERTRGRV